MTARILRGCIVELIRIGIERDPVAAATARDILAKAMRAGLDGELIDVLRAALANT